MKKNAPVPPSRAEHNRFLETIASLRETIDELQARNEALKRERQQLLEKNRSLRRELTQTRLLKELEDNIEAVATETEQLPSVPLPTEDLYHLLPSSFSFGEFFRIAESEDVETDDIRDCLLHFPAEGLITQEGSRLVKKGDSLHPNEFEGDRAPGSTGQRAGS